MSEYIAKVDCQHRGVYRLRSRNLAFGVYNQNSGGFCGLRTKFGHTYVFEEYHWDNEDFTTVKPLELLPDVLPVGVEPVEYLPDEDGVLIMNKQLFEWLQALEEKYKPVA